MFSKESMYHQKLKTQHPDVYSAVINKRIDLVTAYKWSSEDVNTNRKFSYKLDQLLDLNDYYCLKDSDAIDDEQIFVRELVHILTKYNLSSFTISKLQNDIKALRNKNTTLENSIDDLNNKIYQLTRTAGQTCYIISFNTFTPKYIYYRRSHIHRRKWYRMYHQNIKW